MKHWIPRKRPGEMADTARISKAAKARPEDIKKYKPIIGRKLI